MPVTMPGSASGSTSRNDTVSRPKNRNRWTASAASEPSSRARAVAASATSTDSSRASRIASLLKASPNQCVVQLVIGQVCARSALNAYRKMITIGTYRKTRTPIVARPTSLRLIAAARSQGVERAEPARHEQVHAPSPATGIVAYAAANGMLPATPWLS